MSCTATSLTVLHKLGMAARRALLGWTPGGLRKCVFCGNSLWGFIPYNGGSRNVPALIRELQMVGSDVDNFLCPRCGSHDRERHLLMYLQASGALERMKGKTVLHFAPEKQLSLRIAAMVPATYIRCDLHPTLPEVQRIDILAINMDASSVDYVLANHVLEHVDDDTRALREIRRVLKPGGYAILQTPYAGGLKRAWEDPGITSAAARLQAYGQSDHVRLYGSDIFERFVDAGLESHVKQHAELLPHVDISVHGVNPVEPFFHFRKPARS